jgi:hypothetical protein
MVPFFLMAAFVVFVLLMVLGAYASKCESYSPVTGFSYQDGCHRLPVPENIKVSSRSPPFYDLMAVRRPEVCAYRNFTFPPPMKYPPIQEPDPKFDIYQYWFKDAVLSHPQTAYLV